MWQGCFNTTDPLSAPPKNSAEIADSLFRSYSACRFELQGIVLLQRRITARVGGNRDTIYFPTTFQVDTTLAIPREEAYTMLHDSTSRSVGKQQDTLIRSVRCRISADSVTRTLDSTRWVQNERFAYDGIVRYEETKEFAFFLRHLTPDAKDASIYILSDRVTITNLLRPVSYRFHSRRDFDGYVTEIWEETWSVSVPDGAIVRFTFLR
jgi:hypothetical protein